jgi:hypothetical protein
MMTVFNVLFLTVICGLAFGVFLAVWLIVLYIMRVRRKRHYALFAVPTFFVLLVSTCLYACRPSAAFERMFGFAPTSDVIAIQSSQWELGDSGVVFLRFKANPVTIRRIVARGLSRVSVDVADRNTTSAAPPRWWRPPKDSTEVYLGSFDGRRFAWEDELLFYDSANDEGYFRFTGID